MGDELLDAALARADRYGHKPGCYPDPDRDPYVGCVCGETRREDLRRDVRALVERVRVAESERDDRREFAASMEDYDLGWGDGHAAGERGYFAKHVCPARIERGREHLATKRDLREARGKLDALRALCEGWAYAANPQVEHEASFLRAADDVLAIIDTKGSTRPQDATGR